MAEIVIQDCGCIAIPEAIAASLGMVPGARIMLAVDEASRSITLSAPLGAAIGSIPTLAACSIKP